MQEPFVRRDQQSKLMYITALGFVKVLGKVFSQTE